MRPDSIESIFFVVLVWLVSGLTSVEAVQLSPLEEAGRRIYHEGIGAAGKEIVVEAGRDSMVLPGSVMPCVKCHGIDGMGQQAAGSPPTAIVWSRLTEADGHRHASGRVHGPFDEASVARAITEGIDPNGNPMATSMPRFRLSKEDLNALIAYLKRLEADIEPGLANGRVQLATLLPVSGPMAEFGLAMQALLNASIKELNGKGGIHGRSLELDVIPYGESAGAALENMRRAIENKDYFAVVGAYSIGLEIELASLLEAHRIPQVGPFSLHTPFGRESDGTTFYLLSGFGQQIRVLANHAVERLDKPKPTLAIVGPDTPLLNRMEATVSDQFQTRTGASVQAFHYPQGGFDPLRIVDALNDMDCDGLFFLDGSNELDALLGSLALAGNPLPVYLISTFISQPLYDAPVVFNERIFVAYATLPSDITADGGQNYTRLKKQYRLPESYLSSQLALYASLQVVAEGLRRAGNRPSRSRFISSLEGLNRFETGVVPPITYHQRRRIGALGGYIMVVDLKSKSYRLVDGWNDLR